MAVEVVLEPEGGVSPLLVDRAIVVVVVVAAPLEQDGGERIRREGGRGEGLAMQMGAGAPAMAERDEEGDEEDEDEDPPPVQGAGHDGVKPSFLLESLPFSFG